MSAPPMEMLVTRSRMISTTTGTRYSCCISALAFSSAGAIWSGSKDANRLAAQAFRDLDVVDAVAAEFGGVDVLERELDLVVHLEAALTLPDQPEVGVVHHHVDVRSVELRADRQFFDHELEVVVTGKRHDGRARVRGGHAQRRRQRPAQRAHLPAVDPVPRMEHVQAVSYTHLRQPDGADVPGVLVERLVHLLVHPLRLDPVSYTH